MVYKKLTSIAIMTSIIMACVSGFVFGSNEVQANDQIIDGTMQILILIQKYSWPVITLVFIYALYKFYIIGSEMVEHKITGQRLIIGIALFMVMVQALPLLYAFLVIN